MHDRLLAERPGRPDLRSARNDSLVWVQIGPGRPTAAQMSATMRSPFGGTGWTGALALLACTGAARAQGVLDQLSIPDPAPLPSPPLFERFVLEQPWYPAIVLVLGAIVVGMSARHAGRKGGPWAFGLAVLAIVVMLTGSLVETPREKMVSAARRLVDAVATLQHERMDAELHESVSLELPWLGTLKKREIHERVDELLGDRYALHEHDIIALRSARDGANVGRVQVKVRAIAKDFGVPHFSWWNLDYREDAGVWRVVGIRPISMSMEPRRGT